MVNTLPKTITETSLYSWLREYIEYAGLESIHQSLAEIRDAMSAASLEYVIKTDNVQELLDELDLPVLIEDETGRIALAAVTNEQEADAMLAKHSDEKYVLLRQSLGIDYLVILQVNENLGHTRNDIFEAYVEFSALPEKPECLIISL
ncbi:hypothetical protein [Chlorogloea sp. CCALA 695]|uniref:hypothetical protein n=1 Tax=Chlorogloea sp. CCALA 695 TaxID=2107693 RepID=UPI000D085EE1|nr:hypothetical protein [Chlorogloea sp. CCALA 695]PSB25844.1 hypothetical protein C7B70_24535 [Chlorogloea sp. CCALA 695]